MKESQNVEWKQSWRDEYLKWICGFANADGGTLMIGKNDQGKVVGVANASRLLEDIPNKVRDILGIVVAVNLHVKGKFEWLEIIVDPYPSPISYKGEYHLRSGSTKQELKGAALDRFLLRKLGRHWDGVPTPHFAAADLDPATLNTFRKLAAQSGRLGADLLTESDAALIEKLHLKEGSYFKRAAALLFARDDEKLPAGAYIKIGFFRTDSDLLYQDAIHGNLFTQIDKTLDLLLTKYLRAGISYTGSQRFERFPVPEAALREAVINAIAHKDYGASIPTQISVYNNKLIIWNAGQLPPEWSIGRLLAKHASQPSNPAIANAFFLAGKIESWGRGIDLIRDTCERQDCPAPSFASDSAGFWVEFPFSITNTEVGTSVETIDTSVETIDTSVKTANTSVETADTSVEITDTSVETTDTSVEILSRLQADPSMTLAKLAVALSRTKRAIELATAKLVADGKLQRVGPRKGGHWVVLK